MRLLTVLMILYPTIALACAPAKKSRDAAPVMQNIGDQKPEPAPAPVPEHPSTPAEPAPMPSTPVDGKTPSAPNAPAPQPQPQPQPCTPTATNPCTPAGAPVVFPGAPVIGGAVPVLGAFQDCYRVRAEICALENETIAAIDAYRTARGLIPLAASFQMGFIARRWSAELAEAGVLSVEHPAFYADQLNLTFGFENVIIGGGFNGLIQSVSVATVPIETTLDDVTGAAVLNALLANPDAALDVLYPGWRALGVGIVATDTALFVTVLWSI